jgi:hypothetical protein
MSYRLTSPGDPPGDEAALGYAEYGGGEDAGRQAPTPRRRPSAEGYAGSYGQHDFVGSARRSDLRSVRRYRDSAHPDL